MGSRFQRLSDLAGFDADLPFDYPVSARADSDHALVVYPRYYPLFCRHFVLLFFGTNRLIFVFHLTVTRLPTNQYQYLGVSEW